MDISEILSSLSSEDMEQLKKAANAIMGNSDKQETDVAQSPDLSHFAPEMLSSLSKVSKTLSGDDEKTALLKALRPMLSAERQQKADEAIKVLKLLQLLPLLRDSGLLKGLL